MTRWPDRQLALLREMGVRLWLPPGAAAAAPQDEVAAEVAMPAAPAARPVASPAPSQAVGQPVRAPVRPVASPRALPVGVAGVGASAGSGAVVVPQLDWPALRDAVAACTACALHAGRRQPVFGVGSERADWMVIGESPGDAEDIEGVPFVGKAGQLLDNMLLAIGLTRGPAATPAQQVYIANAVKCRPPGTRSASGAELAQCEGFLLRQVQLVRPRIILAMGPTAVQHLLRSKEPIGKLRGRVHDFHGVPLIVTYHPTYLLRNLQDKARVWDDLCLAVETVGRG